MSDDYEFDDDVAFEPEDPAPPEDYTWGGTDDFSWDDVTVSNDEEKTLFQHFLQLGKDRSLLLPICIKATIPESIRNCILTADVWQDLPTGPKHDGWRPFMKQFTVAQCATVAQRFIHSVTYSSNGDSAINAYHGYGHYDPARPGKWVPDEDPDHKYLYVVPVTARAAATAQMAAACTKMQTKTTYKPIDGRTQAISTYVYERVSPSRHPEQLKLSLANFVALPTDPHTGKAVKVTRTLAIKRPFYWEALAEKLAATAVLAPEMHPISAYFFLIGKEVAIPNAKLNIDALRKIGKEMSFKNYRHAIKHGWYSGGVKVPQGWFMCYDQMMHFHKLPWSGHFSTSLPDYAMFYGAQFERSGASVGEPRLQLKVSAVAEFDQFTGVVWNPSCPGSAYVNAAGVALPLGDNMISSLKPGLEWLGLQTEECSAYAVAAPQPYIVIARGKGVGGECSAESIKDLYQGTVGVCIFNFVNALCCTSATDRPVQNVFSWHLIDGTAFYEKMSPTSIVPGRYSSVSKKSKKEEDLDSFFSKYVANVNPGTKRGRGPAETGPSKRAPPGVRVDKDGDIDM